jgi:hypothetical protein
MLARSQHFSKSIESDCTDQICITQVTYMDRHLVVELVLVPVVHVASGGIPGVGSM